MMRPEVFSDDLGFIEGPAWHPKGTLHLVSISRGLVYELAGDSGAVLSSASTAGGPNGLTLGLEGHYVAQNGGIFGASGDAVPGVQVVAGESATYLSDEDFDAPNDLCVAPDGRLIVTDPASEKALVQPVPGRVLACDPLTGDVEVLLSEMRCPNGLAISADDRSLYLAQSYLQTIQQFWFEDARLVAGDIVCQVANGRPDGIAIDMEGNLWVCVPASGGVNVYDPGGTQIERIECGAGSMTTNLCFGGPGHRRLFITAAGLGSVLTVTAPVPGLTLHPFRPET